MHKNVLQSFKSWKTLRATNYIHRYTYIMYIFTYTQTFKMAKFLANLPSQGERQTIRKAKCVTF